MLPTTSLFDQNLSANPSLTALRYLLIIFTCFVLGSTLLRILDTLGLRRGSQQQRGGWRSSRCFVGSYRVRKGSQGLEPSDGKSEWVEGRLYEHGDEDGNSDEFTAVAPDVKDACVQT